MPTHPKPDLAVTVLLQNLNDELDRKKMKKVKMEDLMLAKTESSVRGRIGRRINEQHVQISHRPVGSKFCGAIFMCNKRTWKECLGQCLFGLPIGKKGLVDQIVPGMKLFLFEFERRQLWGVFEAASYGGMNIIPNAYTGGSFPCQVRVKVPENCVALYEDEFRETIRDNYYGPGKFNFDLSEKQVYRLAHLFERKYLSANISSSDLIGYENELYMLDGCKSDGGLPLLLANEATSLYPEELTNGPFFFDFEEDMDHFNKKAVSRSWRKSSEKGSLIPHSNGVLDIVHNNVASLAEDLPTEGMCLFSDSASRLHSDRPIAKSVWARISGHSKSFGDLESTQLMKSPEVTPAVPLPKVCTIVEMDVEDESLVHDQDCPRADAGEEGVEEFSIGFKRRRASKKDVSTKVDETPSKRRRKLTRPSFEDAADEVLVEQGKCVPERPLLPSANGTLEFSKSSSMVGPVEDSGGNNSVRTEMSIKLEEGVYLACDTVSNAGEEPLRKVDSGCKQENGIPRPAKDGTLPNLDLNLPLEVSVQDDQGLAMALDSSSILKDEMQFITDTVQDDQGLAKALDSSSVLKDEMQFITDTPTSRVSGTTEIPTKLDQSGQRGPNALLSEMQEEPCLALSLATQETVLHSREGMNDRNPADLIGHLQKQSGALVAVDEAGKDHLIRAQIVIDQSDQGGTADGEVVNNETGFLGVEGQGSDVQQSKVSPAARVLDLAPADSPMTSTMSLAPCTPAKDLLENTYSASEHCDEGKGSSHGLEQDIPLTLELGSGVQLPDVKFRLHDIIHPEHAPGDSFKREDGGLTSCKGEDGNNAVVHDGSLDGNQSRESKTISIDCTAGSNLLKQGDLKTLLSSLQVSGIKLQLGATPCLIFQLGDSAGSSSKNVDSQEQGGAASGQSGPS